MARPIYTDELYSTFGVLPAGVYTSADVPLGQRWIIRDVVAYSPGTWPNAGPGVLITDSNNTVIWSNEGPYTHQQRMYHDELRQAMDEGDHLVVTIGALSWSVRVTGYVLTA